MSVVRRDQLIIAMYRAGTYVKVRDALMASKDPEVMLMWENTPTINSDWPIVKQIADVIGSTQEDIDSLFANAAQINP